MNTYVLWIEMDRAKVFKVDFDGPRAKVLRRKEIKHHTSRDPKNHKDCEKFFHSVAAALKGADEIYLLGHGLAQQHFKAHLARHGHLETARSIIGQESLDRASDAQLLARSRRFFKEYDLFEQPIAAS